MTFTLVDVAGANFRTDEESDKLNSEFMRRLGVKARLIPARLAIARSLASPGQPDLLSDGLNFGKSIKGDTLFGTGASLSTWLALIVQKQGGGVADLKHLVNLVAAHWRRGLTLLDAEWAHADQSEVQLIKRLVEVAGLPVDAAAAVRNGGKIDGSLLSSAIRVLVGEVSKNATTGEEMTWAMNGPGSSPHAAIMGGVGSGKTRTAVAMLKSIRQNGSVPFLAFDFKGDLSTDAEGNGYHLEEVFGATVLQPPKQVIPLNVLTVAEKDTNRYAIAQAALRFRESFSNLKGTKLGDRQKSAITDALERSLQAHDPCELIHVQRSLRDVYVDREMSEDGAISMMEELCRFPLFEPIMDPAQFFSKSWIISLPQSVPEAAKSIIVNLMLDSLDAYLNTLNDAPTIEGCRAIRILCVIDEAHRILGTRLPALANLIRMSRSKGGAIMLISQSPDDFANEEEEFLAEMGLVAAFASNARPAAVSRIFGKGANLTKLSTGQCWVKMRGDSVAHRVIAWEGVKLKF